MNGTLVRYQLQQDRKGMVWDLLLYVPTVIFLGLIALKFSYEPDSQWLAYLLYFMACFFLIAGSNRILKTRLMLLSSAPVALELGKQNLRIVLRSGAVVELIKNIRFYPDHAGRSFGLTGMESEGKRLQFVLHKGQFQDQAAFGEVTSSLKIYK